MHFSELVFIALGLSMDAFAVSICKGLSQKQNSLKNMLTAGAFFGSFQAFMPVLGFLSAFIFRGYICAVDHWIAFVLLSAIGLKMLWDSRRSSCDFEADPFRFKLMLIMALATSIDALAVGVTFAFLDVNILWAAALIGLITFILSALGVGFGHFLGTKIHTKAEMFGGLVLLVIGLKILVEHLRLDSSLAL